MVNTHLYLPVVTTHLYLPVVTTHLYLPVDTIHLYLPVDTIHLYLPVDTIHLCLPLFDLLLSFLTVHLYSPMPTGVYLCIPWFFLCCLYEEQESTLRHGQKLLVFFFNAVSGLCNPALAESKLTTDYLIRPLVGPRLFISRTMFAMYAPA